MTQRLPFAGKFADPEILGMASLPVGERRAGTATNLRLAWLIVFMLSLFMLISFADKVVFGLSAVPIMREFSLSHTQFGLIGTSFFLFFSASAVGVGFLANRVAAKRVVAAMALAWSLCQLLMFVAAGLPALIANRLLLGLGEGPAYPVALHAAYRWIPDSGRPLATSLVAIGAAIGAGVAAPAIVFMITVYSWQVAFGALGILGVAWAILWMALGREGPLAADATFDPAAVPLRFHYARLLTGRTFIGAILAGFAAYWLVTTAVIWLPAYLQRGLGFSTRETGWIMTLPALCQIGLMPGICRLSEIMKGRGATSRLSRGYVAAMSVLLAGILTMLLPQTRGSILPILCVALAFSIATPIFSLGPVMIAELAADGQRGAMLGIYNAVVTLAGPLAPVIMGMIVDTGTNEVAGFRTAITVTGGTVAAAALAALLLINPEAELRRRRTTPA